MARRLYFLFGDLLANAGVGALAGLAAAWLAGRSGQPLLGMLGGMVVGMPIAMIAAMALTPLFGAFEVMLPATTSGMLSGMLNGMIAAERQLAFADAARLGAAVGVAVLALISLLDRHIRHREAKWTK